MNESCTVSSTVSVVLQARAGRASGRPENGQARQMGTGGRGVPKIGQARPRGLGHGTGREHDSLSDGLGRYSRGFRALAYMTICVADSTGRKQARRTGQTEINANGGQWRRQGENARLRFDGAGKHERKIALLGDGQEQAGAGRGRHVGDSLGIR